jgi:hypothetical protein
MWTTSSSFPQPDTRFGSRHKKLPIRADNQRKDVTLLVPHYLCEPTRARGVPPAPELRQRTARIRDLFNGLACLQQVEQAHGVLILKEPHAALCLCLRQRLQRFAGVLVGPARLMDGQRCQEAEQRHDDGREARGAPGASSVRHIEGIEGGEVGP